MTRGRGWPLAAGITAAIAAVLFGITLVILCMSGDGGLLAEEMLRAAPPERTGLPEAEYASAGRMIAGYLTGTEERFQYTYTDAEGKEILCFQPHEEAHMADCRALIALDRTACFASLGAGILLTAAGLWKRKTRAGFRRGILWGLRITAVIAAALLAWAIVDFDGLFVTFHRVAFTNTGWLLDSRRDLLIRLMPVEFFIRLGIRGLLWALIVPTLLEAGARLIQNSEFIIQNYEE